MGLYTKMIFGVWSSGLAPTFG